MHKVLHDIVIFHEGGVLLCERAQELKYLDELVVLAYDVLGACVVAGCLGARREREAGLPREEKACPALVL